MVDHDKGNQSSYYYERDTQRKTARVDELDKDLKKSAKKTETPRSFLCGTYAPQPLRDTFGNNENIKRSLDFGSSPSSSLRCRSLEASQRLLGSIAFKPANRHSIAQEKPSYQYIDEYNLSRKEQPIENKHTEKAVSSL